MLSSKQQLQAEIAAAINLPCSMADQERLSRYDSLVWEGGHSIACALGIVRGSGTCVCGAGTPE